jgi:hypothetical protein
MTAMKKGAPGHNSSRCSEDAGLNSASKRVAALVISDGHCLRKGMEVRLIPAQL